MLDNLKTVILKAISKDTDVCLAVDANEALDTKNQHFHEWIVECSLISVHENLYDGEYYETNKIPTTHQNGTSKIDHVFCTPHLFGSVKGVAIQPLHDGIFSDHQALIVDFDTPQLLGQAIHIAKPKTRLLVSTWKKAMHQYRIELDTRLQAQNTYSCANKLLAKYQTTAATTPWMDKQAKLMDKYITNCMLKVIHKHNLEDFSPHKVEMALTENFWKLALQANQHNSILPTQPMKNIINQYPNMDTTGMDDKNTIIQQLHHSKEKYKEAIARGKEIRHDFLLERAQIAHENSSLTIETAIKQLVHIEASIQTYALIKRVMNHTPYQAGLTSIRVPTENGAYRTIVDATKIEAQLMNQNLNHYAQAEHTAMAHHPIREEMGTSRTSNFCNRVLLGTADLAHLPATLQAIFHQLHQPHPVKVDNIISFDDYKDALQKCVGRSPTQTIVVKNLLHNNQN
jgi:hypothetical protein